MKLNKFKKVFEYGKNKNKNKKQITKKKKNYVQKITKIIQILLKPKLNKLFKINTLKKKKTENI